MSDETQKARAQYWWFDGATVESLTKQLMALDKPILKVLPQADGSCLLQVAGTQHLDLARVTFSPLNFSHICPPICPD